MGKADPIPEPLGESGKRGGLRRRDRPADLELEAPALPRLPSQHCFRPSLSFPSDYLPGHVQNGNRFG